MITQLFKGNVATGFLFTQLNFGAGAVCHLIPYFFLFLDNATGRQFATNYGLFLQSYIKGH